MSEELEGETPSRGGNSTAVIVGMIILLPVLYVLSIGPVAGFCTRTGTNPEPLRYMYLPVIWLHDHTPLRKPLEYWVELWGGR